MNGKTLTSSSKNYVTSNKERVIDKVTSLLLGRDMREGRKGSLK